MKMLQLTSVNGKKIWLNMERVQAIIWADGADGSHDCSQIYFAPGEFWSVIETPEVIGSLVSGLV